ncbi:hypothetical protein BUALT_Bualt15G0089700 [Buddleja alternifolia]|uniref:MADS-box domain-containing protein n=1 Tax=Buddleja alternifolia TaxID=168488 RepID=A0AAV6WLI0_9LAMI|nr:hypothetical protein BUALT_Bualt15G0089700 [Buddleja alternifolia]
MELISKEKSRNITFKKRKEGLIRKMHEFTTLCDVSACMIIYGPKQEKGGSSSINEPEIWPQNMEEIHRIIDIYKSKNKDSGNKTFGLSDFFHDRKRKIEEELAKLRKKNMESKYPTWLEFMNFLTEEKLREFSHGLRVKCDNIKSRIESMKRSRDQGLIDMSLIDFAQSRMRDSNNMSSYGMRGVELEIINQHYNTNSTLDHHQELHHQNSMMMLLMNDHHNDHCEGYGGGPTGVFKRQVYYESTSAAGRGVVDPMSICHSPRPLARYYAPPGLGPVAPYMAVAPLQLQFPVRESHIDGEEDMVQYQMKKGRYY